MTVLPADDWQQNADARYLDAASAFSYMPGMQSSAYDRCVFY